MPLRLFLRLFLALLLVLFSALFLTKRPANALIKPLAARLAKLLYLHTSGPHDTVRLGQTHVLALLDVWQQGVRHNE